MDISSISQRTGLDPNPTNQSCSCSLWQRGYQMVKKRGRDKLCTKHAGLPSKNTCQESKYCTCQWQMPTHECFNCWFAKVTVPNEFTEWNFLRNTIQGQSIYFKPKISLDMGCKQVVRNPNSLCFFLFFLIRPKHCSGPPFDYQILTIFLSFFLACVANTQLNPSKALYQVNGLHPMNRVHSKNPLNCPKPGRYEPSLKPNRQKF